MTEIIRHDDAEQLASSVAERFMDRLVAVQDEGRVPHVALTGGSIANAVYRSAASSPRRWDVAWDAVEFWWGDERFVPRDSPDRNAVQARQALLDTVRVDPARVHEMPSADDGDLDACAAAYSDEVRSHGSGAFDVVLLGLGPDGHIASLFPGYPQLEADDRIAVAVEESPKPPPLRISLTFGALNRTRALWFVVAGEDKAAAVARSTAGGTPVSDSPAVGVHGTDETLWLLDESAAGGM